MATPVYRGTDEPVMQSQNWRWTPQSGGAYDEVWKGISLTKMTNKYNGLVYTANEAEMTFANGVAELKIHWGSGGSGGAGGSTLVVTTDRWECPEPEISKSIWDHPNWLAALDVLLAFASLSVDDYNRAYYTAKWAAGAASGSDFKSFISGTSWASFVAAYPAEASYMARTYQKGANGQLQYYDSQYSVRHTTRAPNYWSRNVSDDNVNYIYSPARFISEVTDVSLWNFPMPGRLQYKVSAAVASLIARVPARSYYQFGWLKKASAESTIHGGWIEISTGYVLDQWSTDLYGYVS